MISGFTLFIVLYGFILIALLVFVLGRISAPRISPGSYQNKLLVALRHLGIAAIPITEVEPACQEIVDIIREELGYLFGSIALIDHEGGGLRRIAISSYPEMDRIIKSLPIEYKKQVVPFDQSDNLLIQSLQQRKVLYSERLYDVQKGIFTPEISDRLQKELKIKGLFVYPLYTKQGLAGIIYYCTFVERKKFSSFEFEIMDEFTREVSMVLDNVFLYQHSKESAAQLMEANKELKEADKLKDDFVSIVSHELRTPMTAIRSYAWMALHRSDMHPSEKMTRYLIRVMLSTERLINLVNDILNLSRIESGKIEIDPEAVDLYPLIRDIVDEVYFSKSQEKQIQFEVLEKDIPKVFADPGKLRQVFLNIVGNALKFTPHDGKIIFDFSSDGQMVEASVSDTGVGIAKEDISRLFHKFGRLDNSYTSAATSGGTGLGLYISKNLVELMHGRIWASSEGAGKGTTFTVALPVATKDRIDHANEYAVKPKEGEAKPLESASI